MKLWHGVKEIKLVKKIETEMDIVIVIVSTWLHFFSEMK